MRGGLERVSFPADRSAKKCMKACGTRSIGASTKGRTTTNILWRLFARRQTGIKSADRFIVKIDLDCVLLMLVPLPLRY